MRMPTALLAIALIAILVACQGETVTVEVPADTPTPQPTYTPYPTLEALPTYTPLPPLPTNTPYPTFTPQPTYTPAPTPAPVIETVIERDRWTPYYLDETVVYVVVGDVGEHSLQGGWLLQLTCSTENKPGVYIERA